MNPNLLPIFPAGTPPHRRDPTPSHSTCLTSHFFLFIYIWGATPSNTQGPLPLWVPDWGSLQVLMRTVWG